MASEIVNVPICSIPEIFQKNRVKDYMAFLKMKATEGRWLVLDYPAAMLERFVKRGWLKYHEGKHYQVAMVDAFPLDEKYTHAKLPVEVLDDPKLFKAMLFVLGCAYLMSPQAQRGCKPRRKRKRPHVNESKHIGGVSLTLCMKFFGMSKTWCFNMKKVCESLGIAKWKRRWVTVRADGPDGEIPDEVAEQMMRGPGRYKFDKQGRLVEEVTAKFTCKVYPMLHIPYEYRRETHQRYM